MTGVVPGNYGGAEVNAAGQFTYIPPSWPASALPVFPLVGGAGGGGTATTASAVSYVPRPGAVYVLATNVQAALDQVDAALVTVEDIARNSGVMTLALAASSGLALTGTTTNPVLSLAPTGISAGTYAGFRLNSYGQVISYTAPAPTPLVFTGGNAVTISQPTTNTWVFDADAASFSAPGVVQLVNPADTISNSVPPSSAGFALTWDGLQNWFLGNNVVLGGQGIAVSGAARTVALAVNTLTTVTTVDETATVPVFNTATAAHVKMAVPDARRLLRGSIAAGLWTIGTGTLASGLNIQSTTGSAGSVTVTMAVAHTSTAYGVCVAPLGGHLTNAFFTVTAPGIFVLNWTTSGSTATAVAFNVFAVG